MRLIMVDIAGYKRLFARTTLNTDGRLIALVGQNNAGKSSVLDAIARLEDREEIGEAKTRREKFDDDHETVIARFLLDDQDRVRVAPYLRGQEEMPRWLHVTKRNDGRIIREVFPPPVTIVTDRHELADRLERALPDGGAIIDEDGEEIAGSAFTAGVLDTLRTDEERLPAGRIEELQKLAEIFRRVDEDDLATELETRGEVERQPILRKQVADELWNWSPDFVTFKGAERELKGSYDLNQVADDPPAALANLAAVAGLDLPRLRDAKAEADTGLVKPLIDSANERLASAFKVWEQFDTTIVIADEDRGEIVLLVPEADGTLSNFDDQSDGFQMFTALIARIMSTNRRVPPIVLIDEIEMHLHYDAEADLLRGFGAELQVDRVVYSTHSIGCLPPDIGTGVRVVRRIEGSNFSEIDNHLWHNRAGVDPLLYALGATTLSFVPLRDALLTEGPSELLVLPTLLREAMGLQILPFQVLPGIAHVPPGRVAGLDTSAPRVAWMVDNDEGGRAHAKKVRKVVDPARVLVLDEDEDLCLEDLVDAEIYLEAVNDVLSAYTEKQMPAEALTEALRPNSVKAWCEVEDVPVPGKIAVCQRIIDRRTERQLLQADRRELVQQLYARIETALAFAREPGSK